MHWKCMRKVLSIPDVNHFIYHINEINHQIIERFNRYYKIDLEFRLRATQYVDTINTLVSNGHVLTKGN